MSMKEKSALFLGRFQPPHRGHEKAIGWILARHAKIRIAIGSSNKRRERENPYSAQERRMLLGKIISAHRGWKGRVSFSYVPDFAVHEKWMALMLAKFPPEKYEFYTNNPLVQKLFAREGFAVLCNLEFRRLALEGKKIRGLIRNGKNADARLSLPIRKWMEEKGMKIISRC